MSKNKISNKSFTYYLFLILIILGIIYIFSDPITRDEEVIDVEYSKFLDDMESELIDTVNIEKNSLSYTLEVDNDSGEIIYKTDRMDDPQLVDELYDAGIDFHITVEEESTPILSIFAIITIPMIFFVIIYFLFFRRLRQNVGGTGSNAANMRKSQAKIHAETKTDKSFADVAGQDEAKEALQEVVNFLHNPKRYKEIGAKMPKGVLLIGPPGTGKTLLARAVAGESKVPFFSISGSEFVEMFVGVGAARVRDLFKQAREKAPCIVFIDELDTIGKSRSAMVTGSNNETEQTLNQLLSEMDGFEADEGVVILAATNRPETLDKALLRAGRFDRRVPVELPDIKGREAILKVHAKNVKLDESVDLHAVAKATPGASGADLANIINESALHAVKKGRKTISQDDLDQAVEVTIAGYEKKNAVISKEDREKVAYHEIGHAIALAKQKGSSTVHKITIIPRTSGSLGFTMQLDDHEQVLMSRDQALNRITTLMGGRAAEELVFHSITSGAANDSEQATKIARAMVTRFGMSEHFGMMTLETVNSPYLSQEASLQVSTETATKIDREVLSIMNTCYEEAKDILQENEDKLHELAEKLLEIETMSGEEFLDILNQPPAKE